MPINSTEVSYGFGAFGSTYLTGNGAKVDLSGATAKYYIMAITITETAQFEDLEILDGGIGLGMANTAFVSDDVIDIDAAWGAVTNESDTKLTDSVTTSHAFPAGITLYGMWDNVELHSGACIVYVAPRPDYSDRS
tara:strand:+ start:986 stop:1393 length:408 start_codon:yes stop_codon:yes gene_type:complete